MSARKQPTNRVTRGAQRYRALHCLLFACTLLTITGCDFYPGHRYDWLLKLKNETNQVFFVRTEQVPTDGSEHWFMVSRADPGSQGFAAMWDGTRDTLPVEVLDSTCALAGVLVLEGGGTYSVAGVPGITGQTEQWHPDINNVSLPFTSDCEGTITY
jgi:hypothetical protein